jgi:hypothetical protein
MWVNITYGLHKKKVEKVLWEEAIERTCPGHSALEESYIPNQNKQICSVKGGVG